MINNRWRLCKLLRNTAIDIRALNYESGAESLFAASTLLSNCDTDDMEQLSLLQIKIILDTTQKKYGIRFTEAIEAVESELKVSDKLERQKPDSAYYKQ